MDPITIHTTINSPLSHVWECWTLPEHITQWNTASEDWHTPTAENNLREGGTFSFRMEERETKEGFDFGGTYTTVDQEKLIEYTMDDGRKVSVKFESDGEKTTVTETFDPETENSIEMQREGWQSILDNFKTYTESGESLEGEAF